MELTPINLFFAAIYIFILVVSIISDYKKTIIPNWCSAALAIEFALYSILFLTYNQIAWNIGLSVVVLSIGITFYSFGWFGGGDVKLLSAVMMWAGPEHGVSFMFFVAMIGLIMAFALIILRRYLRYYPNLFDRSEFLRRPVVWVEEGAFPYGIAIGGGALMIGPALFSS